MKLVIKIFINYHNTYRSSYLNRGGKVPHFLYPFEMVVGFELIESKGYSFKRDTHSRNVLPFELVLLMKIKTN